MGIHDDVVFADVRENVEDYYQAMDVFAFPSVYEGLGIVAIEAQSAGLPCICSDQVPREVALTDLCKFLLLDKDVWVEEIVNLQKEKRNNIAVQLAKSNYNVKFAVEGLQEFYMSQIEF